MSKLALVTPDGVPVTTENRFDGETLVEEDPLHVIAAREAAKQSTKNHQQGNDHV